MFPFKIDFQVRYAAWKTFYILKFKIILKLQYYFVWQLIGLVFFWCFLIIRFKLETKVIDTSGETTFTVFNEEVKKMVGEVATVVKELEEARKACALSKYIH